MKLSRKESFLALHLAKQWMNLNVHIVKSHQVIMNSLCHLTLKLATFCNTQEILSGRAWVLILVKFILATIFYLPRQSLSMKSIWYTTLLDSLDQLEGHWECLLVFQSVILLKNLWDSLFLSSQNFLTEFIYWDQIVISKYIHTIKCLSLSFHWNLGSNGRTLENYFNGN